MSESTTAYDKPLPSLEGTTGEFYEFCKNGELRFQRCTACGKWRHVPREMCAACHSMEWEWALSSGRGSVFSWTVVAVPLHPCFKGSTPYAPVVVQMEEGVRLLTELTDVAPDELAVDMPVEVAFEAVTDEVTLPKFRRSAG